MARITHVLKVLVGSVYTGRDDEKSGEPICRPEWREIGKVLEFEGVNGAWEELRLNADILNPVLATLALKHGPKGSGEVRAIRSKVNRRTTVETDGDADASTEEAAMGPERTW